MNIERIVLEQDTLRKLLSVGGDAVQLYLYIACGNRPEDAAKELQFSESRFSCAGATLRQLGLWPEEKVKFMPPAEKPQYSERDVVGAMEGDGSFRLLIGEVQRLLGRPLNTEELKILLSFSRYLGLPNEVVSVLVSYCKERARRKGSLRAPSLRTIEKEAYAWAEQSIDTLEEAAAFIQEQNLRSSRIGHLMTLLQIRGRTLTSGEQKYAEKWIGYGFDDEVIAMAYERTCINTGGFNWPYMNKILERWHGAGFHTAEDVRSGDGKKAVPNGASGQMGQAELDAIARALQEV